MAGYFLSTYYVPVIETLNGRKYYLVQWFLNLSRHHLRCQTAGPTVRISDSIGLGWDLRVCISKR